MDLWAHPYRLELDRNPFTITLFPTSFSCPVTQSFTDPCLLCHSSSSSFSYAPILTPLSNCLFHPARSRVSPNPPLSLPTIVSLSTLHQPNIWCRRHRTEQKRRAQRKKLATSSRVGPGVATVSARRKIRLSQTWIAVSEDAIVGAEQKADAYGKGVHEIFGSKFEVQYYIHRTF